MTSEEQKHYERMLMTLWIIAEHPCDQAHGIGMEACREYMRAEAKQHYELTPSLKDSRKLVHTSAKNLVESMIFTQSDREFIAKLLPSANWSAVDTFGLAELEAFRDRMRANGYRTNAGPVKDAHAAFRTHLRNAVKFASRSTVRKVATVATAVPKKEL